MRWGGWVVAEVGEWGAESETWHRRTLPDGQAPVCSPNAQTEQQQRQGADTQLGAGAHHAARDVQRHLQPPALVGVEGRRAVQQLEERPARYKLGDDAEVGGLRDGAQLRHRRGRGAQEKRHVRGDTISRCRRLAMRQRASPTRSHACLPRQPTPPPPATHELHDVRVAQALHYADFLPELIQHLGNGQGKRKKQRERHTLEQQRRGGDALARPVGPPRVRAELLAAAGCRARPVAQRSMACHSPHLSVPNGRPPDQADASQPQLPAARSHNCQPGCFSTGHKSWGLPDAKLPVPAGA